MTGTTCFIEETTGQEIWSQLAKYELGHVDEDGMQGPCHEIGETMIDVRNCITRPAGGERQDNVYNVTVPKETGFKFSRRKLV